MKMTSEASKLKSVKAKTANQQAYLESIDSSALTFGVGVAGTGKSFLAVYKAIEAFKTKKVSRIVITRPAVEAGENLGFLPGTLEEKLDPYLRPILDAVNDLVSAEWLMQQRMLGNIEIAPLAFMRGRSLNNSFIILDEAQNTTPAQMRMLLTRIGYGSTCVVTGDPQQCDLRGPSGLVESLKVLGQSDKVSIVHFRSEDVRRAPIVSEVIECYERYGAEGNEL